MKLASVFVLQICVSMLNGTIDDQSNACVNQSYKTGVPPDVMDIFRSEFSKLGFVKKKLSSCFFGAKKKPYSINDEMAKQLCACAFYKRNEKAETEKITDDEGNIIINISQPFEDILKDTTFSKNNVFVPIWYSFVSIAHKFPVIVCYLRNEMCALLRGLKKKSDKRPMYDIYVGNVINKNHNFQFQGIISDVDLELRVQPTKEAS